MHPRSQEDAWHHAHVGEYTYTELPFQLKARWEKVEKRERRRRRKKTRNQQKTILTPTQADEIEEEVGGGGREGGGRGGEEKDLDKMFTRVAGNLLPSLLEARRGVTEEKGREGGGGGARVPSVSPA